MYDDDVMSATYLLEIYYNRPLGTGEFQTVLKWVKTYNMSVDLIQYLIEMCLKKEKNRIKYMDAIALNWFNSGIKNIEDAKKYSEIRNNILFPIKKAMNINSRDLIPYEIKTIEHWAKKYDFSVEIYEEACKRTVKKTGKPAFNYAEKILDVWKNAGVKYKSDIKKLDDEHNEYYERFKKNKLNQKKNSFDKFEQRTYTDEQWKMLENKLLGY